jgi:hypothetical protein
VTSDGSDTVTINDDFVTRYRLLTGGDSVSELEDIYTAFPLSSVVFLRAKIK